MRDEVMDDGIKAENSEGAQTSDKERNRERKKVIRGERQFNIKKQTYKQKEGWKCIDSMRYRNSFSFM